MLLVEATYGGERSPSQGPGIMSLSCGLISSDVFAGFPNSNMIIRGVISA